MAKKGSGGRRRYSSEDEDPSDSYSDYSDASSEDYRSPGRGKGRGRGGGRPRGNQQPESPNKRPSPRGGYDNGNGGNGSKSSSPRKSKRVVPLKAAAEVSMTDRSGSGCLGAFKVVGLNTFFLTHDNVRHDDFDGAVRAMALMCTLMLMIPFQILSTVGGHGYLDDIIAQAQRCHGEDGVTYDRIYMGYRIIILATVYCCVCGMILSLFYFLFKRTDPVEYRAWHPKARVLAILMFFFTSFAICSLITLVNWLFDYYLLSSSANICSNSTSLYIFPGLVASGFTYFLGFYLIL